jgi:hypothetical protein
MLFHFGCAHFSLEETEVDWRLGCPDLSVSEGL